MNAPLLPSLAGHPIRILHQQWNDERFPQFGAHLGSWKTPFSLDKAQEILTGELMEETRRLVHRLGFLILEVKGFVPEEVEGLSWEKLVNNRNRLPDVNMLPHTDFADVVLYAEGSRASRTGLSGRTGVVQAVRDALPSLQPYAAEIRLCVPDIRSRIEHIIRESLDYEDQLTELLQELQRSLSDLLAFDPEASWKFWERLYGNMKKRKLHHSHRWNGGQVLMISSQALHFREIPKIDHLIELVPTWRAQIDHDYEEPSGPTPMLP